MGLSIEFYAGDASEIGDVFCARDFERLQDGHTAAAYADFSLHLSPLDLEILSEEVGAVLGREPVSLFDSLVEPLCGESNEYGADRVAREWVETVAALDDKQIGELASRWIAGVAQEHNEPSLQVGPDVTHALSELLKLCRLAVERNLDVVHTWYL